MQSKGLKTEKEILLIPDGGSQDPEDKNMLALRSKADPDCCENFVQVSNSVKWVHNGPEEQWNIQ